MRVPLDRLGRFELLARLGYGARGLVYLIVGWVALSAARDLRGPTDTTGALREILDQPFGKAALAVVAVGLVGHALWRLAQAALDLDGHGSGAKGIAVRGGLLVSAAIHVGLAAFAAALALDLTGWGAGSGGDGTRDWTAWAMRQPFGRWLVGAAGLAVLAAAGALLWKAWTAGFVRHIACDPQALRWIRPIGRVGLAAKAVVFLITGGFALAAAWRVDPSEAGGLAQALLWLERRPFGSWLLATLAVGLLAFGAYGLIQAAYRRIDEPRVLARLRPAA
jgi:hypothetical protein